MKKKSFVIRGGSWFVNSEYCQYKIPFIFLFGNSFKDASFRIKKLNQDKMSRKYILKKGGSFFNHPRLNFIPFRVKDEFTNYSERNGFRIKKIKNMIKQ